MHCKKDCQNIITKALDRDFEWQLYDNFKAVGDLVNTGFSEKFYCRTRLASSKYDI